MEQTISNEVALRIALVSRALPGVTLNDTIEALQNCLGDRIDEEALKKITVTQLKTAFGQTYDLDGEEDGEDAGSSDIASYKEAVKILWGETEGETLPPIEPYQEGDMSGSVRIAVASNTQEQLDGHFGSCLRYLIYQLSATEMRLIDIRSTIDADRAEDKNAFRVNLIRDCQIVFLVSVGGPAAAKVVQANIYPLKKTEGGAARERLAELQQAIVTSPPPWLAKILGVDELHRVKNYKG